MKFVVIMKYMINAYQSIFVRFPLVLHIPSLGPKVERQHHNSVYVKQITQYLQKFKIPEFPNLPQATLETCKIPATYF